mgnify:CR=1 FL=1
MRLGKVCGFLMKAFLAVLMLFVTAAAMEMEIFPAYAGVNLRQQARTILHPDIPRIRGGESVKFFNLR